MTDIAKQFDKTLQATILEVGGIQSMKTAMSNELANLIKAHQPHVPDVICISTACDLIESRVTETLKISGVAPTLFAKALIASAPLQHEIVDGCFDSFLKMGAYILRRKRQAQEQELNIARSGKANPNPQLLSGDFP